MSYAFCKRAFDLCGATLLCVGTLPLWVVIACLLLVTQGPPVLFRHRRVGLGGRTFMLLKFRTMRDGPPLRLPDRPVAKAASDPRVTSIGWFLRRFALDELPQVLNVLKGEMSLVGPRPLPEEDLAQPGWLAHVEEKERNRRLTWADRRQTVLPGVSGLWQITRNDEADFENWIVSDLAYVERRCLALDAFIVFYTPWAVLRGRVRRAGHQSKQNAETTESGPPM
jgi:lipopolysaccharide/colanic/teichoic acid biosynthesis glycosyltransferase